MKELLSPANIISYLLMIIWLIYSIIQIIKANTNYKQINQYVFNSIPSVFTTIGIFGTFLGIFWGLLEFNTDADKMQESIRQLLSGLKTAFSTSLFGLFFSFIFARIVSSIKYRAELKGVVNETTELKALNQIAEILKNIENSNNNNFSDLKKSFLDSNKATKDEINIQKVELIDKLTENQKTTSSLLELQLKNSETYQKENQKNNIAILKEHQNNLKNQNKIIEIQQNASEFQKNSFNKMETFYKTTNSNIEKIDKLILNTNNQLINTLNTNSKEFVSKFDKFYSLLEENTTKAFVEAMEKLTTTFNEQMSELLKRLVQENFQELNNSVKQLNVWQVENKQQIATFTEQFKQIVNNFVKSSIAIESMTINTEKLTNNESYLVELIKQLQAVMIDDVKFVEITKNLTQSAVILDETSEKLVKWTQNDYEFHTAAKILIEQLNQMKDIKSGFWQGARTEMNKVVKSIDDATDKYQNILSERDNQFANWLTTTLKNMDKVMQRHIENTFD